MNKFLVLLALVASVVSGCVATTTYPNGTTTSISVPRFAPFSLALAITHTCTDKGQVSWTDGSGRKWTSQVLGAGSKTVYPRPVYGDREVKMVFESLDNQGRIVAVFSGRFYVGNYPNRAQTWFIGNNRGGSWDEHSDCRNGWIR